MAGMKSLAKDRHIWFKQYIGAVLELVFRFSLYQRIENDRRVWHRDQSVCVYGSFVDYPDLWHGDRFFPVCQR